MIRVIPKQSESPRVKGWRTPPPYLWHSNFIKPTHEKKLLDQWPTAETHFDQASECLHFEQLHFAAHKLKVIYQQTRRGRGDANLAAASYREWFKRYDFIRARLAEANLGLAYGMTTKGNFYLDQEEMNGEAMFALLRAIDTFDPWRGFRFSTYACNAIFRAFQRLAVTTSRVDKDGQRVHHTSFGEEHDEFNSVDTSIDSAEGLVRERIRLLINKQQAKFSPRERTVMALRFPRKRKKGQTLDDIGLRMGMSKEMVRKIQVSALAKLRTALMEDEVFAA